MPDAGPGAAADEADQGDRRSAAKPGASARARQRSADQVGHDQREQQQVDLAVAERLADRLDRAAAAATARPTRTSAPAVAPGDRAEQRRPAPAPSAARLATTLTQAAASRWHPRHRQHEQAGERWVGEAQSRVRCAICVQIVTARPPDQPHRGRSSCRRSCTAARTRRWRAMPRTNATATMPTARRSDRRSHGRELLIGARRSVRLPTVAGMAWPPPYPFVRARPGPSSSLERPCLRPPVALCDRVRSHTCSRHFHRVNAR